MYVTRHYMQGEVVTKKYLHPQPKTINHCTYTLGFSLFLLFCKLFLLFLVSLIVLMTNLLTSPASWLFCINSMKGAVLDTVFACHKS